MIIRKAKRQRDGTCISAALVRVLKKEGNQTPGTYIKKRHATVVEWVVLRPICGICDRETGYKVEGRRREPWRRLTAARKQLSAALEYISAAERENVGNLEGVARERESSR